MTTTNNTCKKCGCQDSFMVSPAPCPTPVGCPTPQPCSEIFDAQCVRYTGAALTCGLNVVVPSNDTVAEALESIVDYVCNLPITDYTYEIGQYVASQGGVIFHRYKDGGNENYLVVDTTNISTSAFWSNIDNVAIGASAQTTWNGLGNSNAIVAQVGFTSGAAQGCLNSTNNTQTDWYLPAIDELSLLWQNRFNVDRTLSGNSSLGTIIGAVTIGYNSYWSSTEDNNNYAWNFSFDSGTAASDKDLLKYVRAVRKFSI
jgi:hypothetical protein